MRKIYTLFLITSSTLLAQNFAGGFNFYLPSSDTTIQKFLPAFSKIPIGENDFVSIDANGKFSVNGKRIRFWGTNAGADAAFPSKDITGLLAGRLRKFGVNLVRMHHLDNPWSYKSLFGIASTSTRELNQTNLDLLEKYIANLKDNGIYVNMNLHVSRTFRINDNVADYDSLPEFGKCVNFFDPYIIQLHKEYAQQLLTHINPYTGKALVNDPVMAMVEITNENSLYRNWRDNRLKPIVRGGILPFRYSRMLDSLWIDFLKKKYQTTTNLKTTWDNGIIASGQNEQIINGGFEKPLNQGWAIEVHTDYSAKADTLRDNQNPYRGLYSAKVDITNPTGTQWHVQFKQPTLVFQKDSSYTVSFAARSNGINDINVSFMNDQSPYNGYGGKDFQITTDWQIFTLSVKANENNNGHVRITFQLAKEKATFWFDEVSVTNASISGLLADESFESNNIGRIDYADCINYTNNRVKDLSEFYISLQRNYFKEMISYLKNELGVKVPIVGSNWNVGAADMASMSDADYVDNHSYWDHPQFPNIPWSQTDWFINNTPMITNTDAGTIPVLYGGVPIAGKPFTVSEYNHPSPNIYQVESILFSTAYSSFNDADAFMYFAYDEPVDWEQDIVKSYFNINRNSIYMSFFPTAAFAFRNAMIKPSVNPIVINYSTDTLYSLPKHDNGHWLGPSFFERKISLTRAVKTGEYFNGSSTDFSSLPSTGAGPFKTDTDETTWDINNGTLILKTDKINGAAGYLYNLKKQNFGNMTITDFPSSDFGAITWISLTDEPLSQSQKSLITLGSRMQNTGAIWNSDNTSVNNNIGTPPTQIYPLYLKLELEMFADSIKIYPLTPIGKEGIVTPFVVKPLSENRFQVELDQNIYRTLWFGIEKFGNGGSTDVESESSLPTEFKLEQNYPNPFNPSTTIKYSIPNVETRHPANAGQVTSSLQHVILEVYDMLGREMTTLVNEEKLPGNYEVTFDASHAVHGRSMASGIYFYRMQSGEHSITKKMLLMK